MSTVLASFYNVQDPLHTSRGLMFQNILISVTRKTFTDVQLPLPRDKHLFFFNLFWPHHMACGILVPKQGLNPSPSSGGAVSEPLDLQGSLSASLLAVSCVALQGCLPAHTGGANVILVKPHSTPGDSSSGSDEESEAPRGCDFLQVTHSTELGCEPVSGSLTL